MNSCIKAFIASFIAVFLMVTLPYLGFKPQALISPLPKQIKIDLLENIRSKLNLKVDNSTVTAYTSLGLRVCLI